MKTKLSWFLLLLVAGTVTGCEHEHHQRDNSGSSGPGYEYGVGPRYDQGWDHR